MNKKSTTYIMLTIVILIWGAILYKLAGIFISPKTENKLSIKLNNVPLSLTNDSTNYNLIGVPRDPFIKKLEVHTDYTPNIKKAEKPVDLKWPTIKFKGIIKSNNTSKPLAILAINNKSQFINEGQEIDEVKVSKISKDSIEVIYKEASKWIRK